MNRKIEVISTKQTKYDEVSLTFWRSYGNLLIDTHKIDSLKCKLDGEVSDSYYSAQIITVTTSVKPLHPDSRVRIGMHDAKYRKPDDGDAHIHVGVNKVKKVNIARSPCFVRYGSDYNRNMPRPTCLWQTVRHPLRLGSGNQNRKKGEKCMGWERLELSTSG